MGYKTILTALDSQSSTAHLAKFSASLAKTFEAHLVGLHVGTIPTMTVITPMEIPDPSTIQAMQDVATKEAEDIRVSFETQMHHHTLTYEWKSLIASAGYASQGAIEYSRCADLIIARQHDGASASESRSDIESFLHESGRPVLFVPCALTEPKPIERVLIAWNGSREATRATYDALPFLKRASHVDIFSFGDSSRSRDSDERLDIQLAQTLARHGVNVSSTVQEKDNSSSAQEAISQRVSDQSVDLLVMGAYGSSRWWEMLFGGVTRGFLENMTALTLMSR